MNDSATCSYTELSRRLQAAGAQSGAAEAHGLLCGILASGGGTQRSIWLEHLLGEGNTLSATAQECGELLNGLLDDILRELNDDAFGFSLMLPPDEASLPLRTRALSEWCGGFLYGLALGGFREDGSLPDTVREVMHDFYEISHAGFSDEPLDEGDEVALEEIGEYVRISVLLLHDELQPMPVTSRLQ
jgi:yecA family protein